MQILLFSLIVLGLIIYVLYKVNQIYSKKSILLGSILTIVLIIIVTILVSTHEDGLNKAFKSKYKSIHGNKIEKLSKSIVQTKGLSSNEYTYKFIYIVKKDNKEYVCEANNVFVQIIEDEYVFKEIKEECREK